MAPIRPACHDTGDVVRPASAGRGSVGGLDARESSQPGHYQLLVAVGGREEAEAIADALLVARLAACVQVVGPVHSRYWWQGRLESAEEWLCLAKTTADRLEPAIEEVRRRHSYEVPEVVAVPVVAGNPDYLRWVAQEVGGG